MIIGAQAGGQNGFFIAIVLSMFLVVGLFMFSEKLILMMSGASLADPNNYRLYYVMIEEICAKLSLPPPKIYTTSQLQANAFAAGRGPGHASIVVTQSAFNLLSKEELMSVLAHELAHIKKHDVLFSTIIVALAMIISFPASQIIYGDISKDEEYLFHGIAGLARVFFINIAAFLIILGISRRIEFGADKKAAKVMGSGIFLARALSIISKSTKSSPIYTFPILSSLYICDPFGEEGIKVFEQFSRQPSVEERIKRLEKM